MIETLKISSYSVQYKNGENGPVNSVLRAIDLVLLPGECLGLIGESGSGKSTLALSIMGLLGRHGEKKGSIHYGETELTALSQDAFRPFRWKRISMIFQNSVNVFNPTLTIGRQIDECIRQHLSLGEKQIRLKTMASIKMTGLDEKWANAYPHQLSGGMRQKALIAMAISCDPEILLVDEPTMALDPSSKKEIIRLLLGLQRKQGFSMLVISHELPIITALTKKLAVMYAGCLIEAGPTEDVLRDPHHPYTKGLIGSSPDMNPYKDLWGIPGNMEFPARGCVFCNRCVQRIGLCSTETPALQDEGRGRKLSCIRGGIVTLVSGEHLFKTYTVGTSKVAACEDVGLDVKFGEVVSLIGESGSGKSTLGQLLAGIMEKESGRVFFDNQLINGNTATSMRGGVQYVPQDPFSSLDDLLSIGEIVREPLDIIRDLPPEKRMLAAIRALTAVQLPADQEFLGRKGRTLSGGQRQRVALARALTMEPRLLIADEISAMLDPSTGANIMRLMKELQNTRGFSLLFITHDLSLARKISDRVYVMSQGRIIDSGPAKQILDIDPGPSEQILDIDPGPSEQIPDPDFRPN